MKICHLPVWRVEWLHAMTALCDINTSEDTRKLVDAFYDKVNRDDTLAPVFNDVAKVDWATHLPTMYSFWDSMLFGAGTYQGAPFPKHAVLPIQQKHFERWLTLFVETIDENFVGPISENAKARAVSIADTFARRMGVSLDPTVLAGHLTP
ncbi:MAG: group III truncated hemoglobin [Chthoniobacterales bacterium]